MQLLSNEDILSCIDLPDDAETAIRRAIGMTEDRPLRFAFLEGPGDLFGTYTHWREGRHDPRVPLITYSAMIYSLIEKMNAQALLLVEKELPSQIPEGRITFRTLRRDRSRTGIGWHLSEMAYVRKAARIVNEWKPDIVVAHSDVPASVFHRIGGLRILTLHNTLWTQGQDAPRSLKQRVFLWHRMRNLRAVDSAICTSDECARQIRLHLPALPTVTATPQIPLDAPINQSRPANRPLRNIVYLGRVEINKGVLDLVEAFATVLNDHPDLHLHLVGSGGADASLRAKVEVANLQTKCTIHGQCTARQIHSILAESDLLVCPTRSSFPEGLAVVPFEAALHGVPSLLSSAVPAAQSLPDCTITFPADQTDALAAALARLVVDNALHSRLCAGTSNIKARMTDRRASWGSCLFKALMLATPTHRKNRNLPSPF